MRVISKARRAGAAPLAVSAMLLAGCAGPISTWDTHTSAAPKPLTVNVAEVTRQPLATRGRVAPGGRQGVAPSLTQALVRALAEASPPIRAAAPLDVLSALNELGLTAQYAELIAEFNRSGMLERERLRRVAQALGAHYVLLPGLVSVDHTLADRFEFAGFKVVRNRIITLRVWLQLWDPQTGRLVWESAGETTAAGEVLTPGRVLPLDDVAQRLWLRMVQEDLLAGQK
jgi:hypothetical protein